MDPTDDFDEEAQQRGYRLVAGLDEAGRGPLAGPVVAAAVILPRRFRLAGLNDSKQVSESERERLYEEIAERAVRFGIGCASEQEIDAMNILEATRLAMDRAIQAIVPPPVALTLLAVFRISIAGSVAAPLPSVRVLPLRFRLAPTPPEPTRTEELSTWKLQGRTATHNCSP